MVTSLVLVPCKLCKTKVPASDLRKNKDGIYVCNNCLNYGYHGIPELRGISETRNPLEVKSKLSSGKREKIAYLCNSCKFSFTKPIGSDDKNCPMCGKDFNVVRKQNAAELLRSVDNIFE